MKRISFLTIVALFLFALFFTGCSQSTATQAPPTEAPSPTPSPLPTQAPTPTQTPMPTPTFAPTPTETPPMPCTVAFDTNRDGNLEIYIMGPDGSNPTNLTNHPADDWGPALSADGGQIAFISNRENDQGGGQKIYVMKADGSDVRQLTTLGTNEAPDWSRDGARIAYSSDEDGDWDIYVVAADGSGQPVNLTANDLNDTRPVWSPDDRQIAWLSGADSNLDLFVMDADGSNVRQLTDNGRVTNVKWTVDGRIYINWDSEEHGCCNFVMDADGANIISAGGKTELQRYLPFWTADGQRVELAQINLNGSDEEIYLIGEIFPDIFFNLTNNPAMDRNPSWPAMCGPGTAAETTNTAGTPSEVVIGYAGDDEWQQDRKDDFQKACNELGIRCLYGEIPELLEQGVSAIVQNSNAIEVNGLFPFINTAREKGVPVFVLDAESTVEGAYNVTIDHHVWAKTSLGWLLEKIGGQGQVAYFDLHPFDRYTDTIQEMLKDYPQISVVEYRDGKYDREKIKPETVDFAKAYPELKAVWTSDNINNALLGLNESDIPQAQWPLVLCDATLDGLQTWARIHNEHPDFDCTAYLNPPGIAYDAVYAAYNLVSGAQFDPAVLAGEAKNTLYVDIPIITSDDLKEWILQSEADGNRLDQRMSPEEIKERWFLE